jgi:hypothetical protein
MTKKQAIRTGKRTWQLTKPAKPAQVHELKITLCGSKPPIWRRVAVSSNMRLSNLHDVIQIVMGWTNSHLHQFTVRNAKPKPASDELRKLFQNEQWDKLEQRMRRERCISDIRFELENIEDERKVKLAELAPAVKSKFIYEYDFGDGWEHLIEVVKIGPPAEGVKYPVCIAGKLACPPDDSGGVWGYYEKLEVLKNPKHKDYKDILGWMGDDFDPERFDPEAVNAELAELRSGKSRRA